MATLGCEQEITLSECAFDNGLIAPKVGTWRISGDQFGRAQLDALKEAATDQGYSVIYISSASAVEVLSEHLQGELIEFQGDKSTALAAVQKFPRKYQVRPVENRDWPEIYELYKHAFPTRFSRDPRIGAQRALRHKAICMKTYFNNHPQFFFVTLDKSNCIIGVQGCVPKPNGRLDLYESVIHPDHRTGFAVAEMLRANLAKCSELYPATTALVTRIYSDNIVSRNYYDKLGLIRSGGDFYYHLWIDQRRTTLVMDKEVLTNRIARFLQERFLVNFGQTADNTTDLFKNGFIDSFGFMELVSFLETEFQIEYDADELLLGQLNTLDGLAQSVLTKQSALITPMATPVVAQS